MIRSSFLVLALLLAAATLPLAARADTFYVSPRGVDTNSGTVREPFRTLAMACRQTPAGRHTIRLAPGTYAETEPSIVPAGVSIIGSGTEKTVLKWPVVVDMEEQNGIIAPDKFMIQVTDSENAQISGLTLDGKLDVSDKLRDRAHGGIIANRVKNFEIHDVTARSFNYGAIYLAESVNSSIHHCRIDDSGHPHKSGCTGGIVVGDMTDSSVHDNVIRENRGAYGIKAARLRWGWPKPDTNLARSAGARIPLLRARFYHNDVKVRQVGGWGAGQPNMAMELWNCTPVECEIYGNTFNECTSLTGDFHAPKTYRIHHNRFILEIGYSYALEVSTNDLEIDHNYFANGYYPIAHFGGRADGLNIHHNVFDGIEKIDLLHFRNGVKDFQFVNNTVYVGATFPILMLGAGESENVCIARNLFYKTGIPHAPPLVRYEESKKTPGTFATIKPGTLTVTNNAFFNWTSVGDGAIIADPRLASSGRRETFDFFRLQPNSPLIAASIGATAPAPAAIAPTASRKGARRE